MTIASLAMYPFTHLHSAQEHLWDDVRSRLSFRCARLELGRRARCRIAPRRPAAGSDVRLATGEGSGHIGTRGRHVRLRRATVPPMERIAPCSSATPTIRWKTSCIGPDLRVAANSRDSLSGWISLLAVAESRGRGARCSRVDRRARRQHRGHSRWSMPTCGDRRRVARPPRLSVGCRSSVNVPAFRACRW